MTKTFGNVILNDKFYSRNPVEWERQTGQSKARNDLKKIGGSSKH